MPKTTMRQNLIVISMAVLLVFSAIAATVVVTNLMAGSGDEGGYRNVTFTDATLKCEDETRMEFGPELSRLVLDRHSSRYDDRSKVYKIFFSAYSDQADRTITEFFLTCFVKARNGRVSKFDVFENVEVSQGEKRTRGGDKFIEWPR